MKIYLIRHGQTTGDVEDRYGGAYDDDNKRWQDSTELGDKLMIRYSGPFCSPLKRAQQTAEILKARLGCRLKLFMI